MTDELNSHPEEVISKMKSDVKKGLEYATSNLERNLELEIEKMKKKYLSDVEKLKERYSKLEKTLDSLIPQPNQIVYKENDPLAIYTKQIYREFQLLTGLHCCFLIGDYPCLLCFKNPCTCSFVL